MTLVGAAVTFAAPMTASAGDGTAPECIQRDVASATPPITVNIKNNCGKPVSVQVAIEGYPDTPCTSVPAGETTYYMGPEDQPGAKYQQVKVC